ncbi:MAG: hypothetical protein ACRDJ4_00940 [Actinomycetota bacterium]
MSRRALVAGGVLAVLAAVGVAGLLLASDGPGPSPAKGSSPIPTATDPRAEIERAYLSHWDLWREANLKLQPALLEQVTTGVALDLLTRQVQEQKAINQPVQIRVEHNYRIVYPVPGQGPDVATVEDTYLNHSVRLDPARMQPIEPDPNERVRSGFTLRKVEGTWKVSEVVEYR